MLSHRVSFSLCFFRSVSYCVRLCPCNHLYCRFRSNYYAYGIKLMLWYRWTLRRAKQSVTVGLFRSGKRDIVRLIQFLPSEKGIITKFTFTWTWARINNTSNEYCDVVVDKSLPLLYPTFFYRQTHKLVSVFYTDDHDFIARSTFWLQRWSEHIKFPTNPSLRPFLTCQNWKLRVHEKEY